MTTYTGPTPWTAQRERMEAAKVRQSPQQNEIIAHLKSLEEGYRQGYADAKTEAAPLMEALQIVVVEYLCQTPNCMCIGGEEELCLGAIAKTAIAAATGKE